jgi:hypothetical protein
MTTLKRTLRLFLICALVVLGAGFVIDYGSRPRIQAKIWHWRHGYWAHVGNYEIPVPDGWLVQTYEGQAGIGLLDTRAHLNFVDIHVDSSAPDLDTWVERRRQVLRYLLGLREIQEKTLKIGDERIACLGGYEFRETLPVANSLVRLDCLSTGHLRVVFGGTNTEEFYAIISQIRKR